MTYLFAVLAAIANAASSVLQRKADRDEPREDNLSLRLIGDLLHNPTWFLGVCGLIIGFLLQAAALSSGALAVVEPILILELPATLLLAGFVFHRRLGRREWASTAAMTVGLVGLLFFLAPSGDPEVHVTAPQWAIGIAINLAAVGVFVVCARSGGDARRAALLGVASGAAFGLTAALIKAMTTAFAERGFVAIFTTWQTYGMAATGVLGMFLLQSSFNAGRLVAAQPAITATDPIVSILWGTLAFGESVRGGVYLALALVAAAVIGLGIVGLSRSSLVVGGDASNDEPTRAAARAQPSQAAP